MFDIQYASPSSYHARLVESVTAYCNQHAVTVEFYQQTSTFNVYLTSGKFDFCANFIENNPNADRIHLNAAKAGRCQPASDEDTHTMSGECKDFIDGLVNVLNDKRVVHTNRNGYPTYMSYHFVVWVGTINSVPYKVL